MTKNDKHSNEESLELTDWLSALFSFAALIALGLLMKRIHDTGAAWNTSHMLWVFAPPFYTLVASAALSTMFSVADDERAWRRVINMLFLGLICPLMIFITDYQHREYFGWYIDSARGYALVRVYPYVLGVILLGWILSMLNLVCYAKRQIIRKHAAKYPRSTGAHHEQTTHTTVSS